MVGEPLKSKIEKFIANVNEPYKKVSGVSPEQERDVMDKYVPNIVCLDEDIKKDILLALEDGWNFNQDHSKVRSWGRLAVGIAEYLLYPSEIEEVQADIAVDVIARISRWFHSEDNLWSRFAFHADTVVKKAWGTIENLSA